MKRVGLPFLVRHPAPKPLCLQVLLDNLVKLWPLLSRNLSGVKKPPCCLRIDAIFRRCRTNRLQADLINTLSSRILDIHAIFSGVVSQKEDLFRLKLVCRAIDFEEMP